jgi:hypothetical protein
MAVVVRGYRASRGNLAPSALVTLAMLLVAFAAFDDITTGQEQGFATEYTAVTVSAAWLLFVTVQLMRSSRTVLGGLSAIALAGASLAQSAIGPGIRPGLQLGYVAIAGAFLWFTTLSAILLVDAWRGLRNRADRGRPAGTAT